LENARGGLPRSHRILEPAEFAATLKSSLRWRNDYFGIYATRNPHPHGRIGLVVSRKASPRAVTRNRVKRQIRESFRRYQERLCGLDIVVVANPKSGKAPSASLRTSLSQLWEKIEQQCRKS
jgi:ribonuclease P protein component